MYPALTDYSNEILDDLLVGMQRVLAKNPDPAFSLHKLIGRVVTDLIVLSPDTKTYAIICEVMVDDFGKKYLFIWGAYATIKFDMQETYETLKWAAEQTGCTYIEAASHRMAWGRKMESFGVDILPATTYRKYI